MGYRVTVTFNVETDRESDTVLEDIESGIADMAVELVGAGRVDTLSNVDVEVDAE